MDFKARYEDLELLGRGGAGEVRLCHDRNLDIKVAVKFLHASAGPRELARFQAEAKAVAQLNHPNIVRVLDFGQTENGDAYLVMQYNQGKNLAELLKEEGSLKEDKALDILFGIASGLAHAHEKKILHRDVKPANVIFCQEDNGMLVPKLVDFGLAKWVEPDLDQELTSTGCILGTPAYISPEAIEGEKMTSASDVYSFGSMAFEMLTGKKPFKGDTALATMQLKMESEPPTLSSTDTGQYPQPLEDFVSRCLKKNPRSRYRSGKELVDSIKRLIQEREREEQKEEVEATANKLPLKETAVISAALTVLILAILAGYRLILPDANKPDKDDSKSKQVLKEIKRSEDFLSIAGKEIEEHRLVESSLDGERWHELRGLNHSEDLKELVGVPNIERLWMLNDDLTGKEFSILEGLKLKGLRIEGCTISDANMIKLSKFDSLDDLSIHSVKGYSKRSFLEILKMKGLKKLNLGNTIMSDDLLPEVCKLPSLERLGLEHCIKITGDNLEVLKKLPALNLLDLADSGFNKKNLKKVASMKNLKVLDLSALNLTVKDLAPIASMDLKTIYLDRNNLDDRVFKILSGYKKLESLSLQENKGITNLRLKQFLLDHPGCKLALRTMERFDENH
ncbi:MAG: protein kinase [Candidatus Obscuribacterales bacterium]|nr:protein kinase [Candidatus Obscuribacterales bacterium]